MTSFQRYAIYHLPQGELGRFGSQWLGWDVRQGQALPHPDLPGLPKPVKELTDTPRRYGFHATMKAPFRLAKGKDAGDLAAALAQICAQTPGFEMAMALSLDWSFLALRPVAPPKALADLEAALVTGLDGFRAPLNADEIAKRRPETLTPAARAHLQDWGYPHVLELFHYHLTLSGSLPEDLQAPLRQALGTALAPMLDVPMPVRAIALVGQDDDGRFHLVQEYALAG